MRATIISVGSEILRGSLLDTNAQYFARELTSIGLEVIRVSQAPDNLDALSATLQDSLDQSELCVVSGGLGPTEDDLTREAIIRFTEDQPTVDQPTLESIQAMFARRGARMPSRNEKQAWKIPSAEIVPNHNGTAPGWLVRHNAKLVAVLPGPPRENRPMWEQWFRPVLISTRTNEVIVTRTLKTIGIGESAVADELSAIVARDWPEVGTYAKQDGVHISVTAKHQDRVVATGAANDSIREIAAILGPYVYGRLEDPLAGAVVQPLLAAGVKMALIEVGTAGALSQIVLGDAEAEAAVAISTVLPVRSSRATINSSVEHAVEIAKTATGSPETGTRAAVVLDIASLEDRPGSGSVGMALVHAGGLRTSSQAVHGSSVEMRRRSGLLAAEFLWRELRIASGLL